jgi:hypothetical protein
VDLMPADEVPETGWKQVLEGQDDAGQIVALIHENTAVLRRMAMFDVIVNNADRRGDHVLAMKDGHRYGGSGPRPDVPQRVQAANSAMELGQRGTDR